MDDRDNQFNKIAFSPHTFSQNLMRPLRPDVQPPSCIGLQMDARKSFPRNLV